MYFSLKIRVKFVALEKKLQCSKLIVMLFLSKNLNFNFGKFDNSDSLLLAILTKMYL